MLPEEFLEDAVFGISTEQAALTAALYIAFYQEEKSARFHDFRDLNSPEEFNVSKAAVSLLHFARDLFNGMCLKNTEMESLTYLVDFLQNHFITLETKKTIKCKCQVTVFSSATRGILERYPHTFDDSCRQLWLYGSMNEGKITLSGVIANIATFSMSQKYGVFCFYCQKYFSGKGSKHRCRKTRSCFACHRILQKSTTYVNRNILHMFCSSEIEPKERQICPKCNLTLYNGNCRKVHDQKVCRWGWFCLKCNQYTFRGKYFKTLKDIREMHDCLMTFCTFCGKKYPKNQKQNHLCSLFKLKPPATFTKIAFLQMTFRGSNAAWCSECKSSSFCSFCADNIKDEMPNIGVLLWEEKPGHFDSYTFTDLDLFDYVSFEKNHIISDHITKTCKGFDFHEFCPKKVKVNKDIFVEEKTAMGQILNFILKKNFTNTTIIINCSESNEPYFFIFELVKKGLVPKVLKHDQRILLVECEEIGLRVVNSQNYVETSPSELSKNLQEERIFFPRKWNKPALYEYVGSIPPIDHFLFFDDSLIQQEEKIAYVSKFKGKWDFKEKLLEHTKQKVRFTAQSMLAFISSAFEMQKRIFVEFSQKNQQCLHPFNRPLLTFSGFAYNLFLLISKSDLRMIKSPIEYNSSKGEVEFGQFLEHVHQRSLQHAWSPHGQTKAFLPISVPDIYDNQTKMLYYYNGCYIHNHEAKHCSFQRKKNKEKIVPGCSSFDTKLEKLSCYNNVSKIKVIWQCGWVKQKRDNLRVKHFMRYIYTNPPTYRLDPRCSGEFILHYN